MSREEYTADIGGRDGAQESGPSVLRIKAGKRSQEIEPVEAGMSRRRFLTFLGTGSAALAAGSAGVLGCAPEQSATATNEDTETTSGGDSASGVAPSPGGSFFTSIDATSEDDVIVPEGFEYTVVRSSEDDLGGGMSFGDHNDFIAYFPIDAREGGDDSSDGLLWVNHEYINPMFFSNYTDSEGTTEKTKAQIEKEKSGVGGSVIRINRGEDGWSFVEGDPMTRRLDATTPMDVTGPAAGSERMNGASEVIGTLANCGGGVTPWNTVLSCEENFQDYYGGRTGDDGEPGNGTDNEPEALEVAATYRWLDAPESAQPPEHYGWVVEIDPFDPESKPRKHSWLGRVRHENAAITVAPDNRVVVYTGHDENDQCIYKFVSSGKYEEGNREANMELLSDGMLYVADFASGKWNALDYENTSVLGEAGFTDQADVLVRAAEAAAVAQEEDGPPLGTPMDRCEDIEIHPENGQVYCALTNNENHGNFYGQIIRMTESGDDPTAEDFAYEVFAAGGPQTGFASPDNIMFDNSGNLWVVTDISSSSLNSGIYTSFKNNGAFVLPADAEGGITGSDVYQFASAPVEAELTGPAFTPDGQTLFLAVQHPGEESESADNPSSTWPGGDVPKSSVVAITGSFPQA